MSKVSFHRDEMVINEIKPIGDIIITTSEKYSNKKSADKRGIIKDVKLAGTIRPIQTVVATSQMAESRGIVVGDKVLINFSRYGYSKQSLDSIKTMEKSKEEYNAELTYSVPVMVIGGQECLKLSVGDIEGVVDVEHLTK